MKNRKNVIIFVFLLSFIILLVSACTLMRKPETDRGVPKRTRTEPTPAPVPRRQGYLGPSRKDSGSRAKRIADEVVDLEEIESATCIVTGDTAMVGVQFARQYKGELTDEVKQKVERVVKQTDPDVDRVLVSADPDIYKRLKDMFQEISRGKPLSGFGKEIKELLNRMRAE